MAKNLSDKLKSLRHDKKVSQEKLAQYLGVSFQAVSKWETGITLPDILMLPSIARFYNITVDELLDVERTDEKKLFQEYSQKAYQLYSVGNLGEVLALWQEAYKKMPNNVETLEMLMSSYFDIDRVKYKDEIISIANDIMNSDAGNYYKGRAIYEVALTYHANGNDEMAEKWATKSYMIHSCMETILYQIYEGKDLLDTVTFFTHWAINQLFYMAVKLRGDKSVPLDDDQKNNIIKTVAQIYETVYPDNDMEFEEVRNLYNLYSCLADYAAATGNEANTKENLEKAYEIAVKAKSIKEHDLSTPILYGWHILDTPNKDQIVGFLKKELKECCYDKFRNSEWFRALEDL